MYKWHEYGNEEALGRRGCLVHYMQLSERTPMNIIDALTRMMSEASAAKFSLQLQMSMRHCGAG